MIFKLEGSWKEILKDEMNKEYFKQIEEKVFHHKEIYPEVENIFHAFNICPYESIRVVIVGQDPYIGKGLADGLAFSVHKDQKIPPSLLNIYKALKSDMKCYIPNSGCLEPWATQGVFLLNSILTSTPYADNELAKLWEKFTDKVVRVLNQHTNSLVFMLWGNVANKKKKLIDNDRHLVLRHNHPSPIIACNTFATCDHFSKANQFLYEIYPTTIDWQIPNVDGG